MKFALFGATGGLGLQILDQGLELGHEITAFVRNPASLKRTHDHLKIVSGDLSDPETLDRAVAGQDLIVSTLGAHGRGQTTLYSEGTSSIIQAMNRQNIKSLICVTSAAINDDPALGFFFGKIIKPLFFAPIYADMGRLEQILEKNEIKNNIKWIVIHPSQLNDKPKTGVYRVSTGLIPPKGFSISRADVADFILKQLGSEEYLYQKVALVY